MNVENYARRTHGDFFYGDDTRLSHKNITRVFMSTYRILGMDRIRTPRDDEHSHLVKWW